MKTARLINGKTFDEIFEQRGKQISITEMVAGKLYLLNTFGGDGYQGFACWQWLSIFGGLNDIETLEDSEIGTTNDLCSDGDSSNIGDTDTTRGFRRHKWDGCEEIDVFEATDDQIALHAHYMQHI